VGGGAPGAVTQHQQSEAALLELINRIKSQDGQAAAGAGLAAAQEQQQQVFALSMAPGGFAPQLQPMQLAYQQPAQPPAAFAPAPQPQQQLSAPDASALLTLQALVQSLAAQQPQQ
jgi:hypothetical protein